MIVPTPARADDSLDQRRRQIEAMSPQDQALLRERQERFARLSPEEQERLRRLHDEIDEAPDAEQLRQIMERYYEWYKALPPYQRAELNELPPAERVKRIKALKQEMARKAAKRPAPEDATRAPRLRKLLEEQYKSGKRPGPQDVEALSRWIEAYASARALRLLDDLPEPRRAELHEELARIKDPARRREVAGLKWLEWQLNNPGKLPPLGEKELADLRAKLTPPTRQRLEAMPPDEQAKTVASWVRQFVLYRYASHRPGEPLPQVTEEDLARFFEKHVNPDDRNRLLSLPEEELQRELTRRYWRWKHSGGKSHGGQQPGHGKRQGSPPSAQKTPGPKAPAK